ncbi:hypothetical protein [Shinella sp.]|uniref:hypothetical protein n=1 Tax=Shinella sp. TaxID=1870904 RepID=UPI003F71E02A
MSKKQDRKPFGSLWGNLDESARIAREQAEIERAAREAKSRRLKEMRLARHALDDGKLPDDETEN